MNRITHGTIKLDREILDLQIVIRAALESVAADIEGKSLQLEVDMREDALFVEADAGRLQQVFRNILSNAVKFTPSGGTIRVKVERQDNRATIAIADSGKGIVPEFLPFVFEMFRQQERGIRREHEGLGVGMALVKRLTELHKGAVHVSSAGVGQGAEVTVRLPLAGEIPDLHKNAPPATQVAAPALVGLSILIVEDADDARESLRLILEGFGARVWVARDGREALDTMWDAGPDLVLCDLRMPRMDGFEFMRELIRTTATNHSPVVAVSALASEADRDRTREAGFEGHLRKPFDVKALLASIDSALAGRRERRSVAS
jgi:CheY-like chemotaxis protein